MHSLDVTSHHPFTAMIFVPISSCHTCGKLKTLNHDQMYAEGLKIQFYQNYLHFGNDTILRFVQKLLHALLENIQHGEAHCHL